MTGWALQRAVAGAALLLAACATPSTEPARGRPDLLRWAVTGDGCPPLTLLAGEYRRAVVERDAAALAAFLDDEALQCEAGAWIRAAEVRSQLLDPGSFLYAALFDGARLRAGSPGAPGFLPRRSQAELLGSEGLAVSVTNLPATRALPQRARVAFRVPGEGFLELGFECRPPRWVLQDWGGLECQALARAGAPHPQKP